MERPFPLILTIISLCLISTTYAQDRVALLIANSDYGEHQLPEAKTNVKKLAKALEQAGFIHSGRLAVPKLCNEAESSSQKLRPTGSPHQASHRGLLLSVPDWLHVAHIIDMMFTFQNIRKTKLTLAHRNTLNTRKVVF